jgi:hypothetical protein
METTLALQGSCSTGQPSISRLMAKRYYALDYLAASAASDFGISMATTAELSVMGDPTPALPLLNLPAMQQRSARFSGCGITA